jgi:uncharacterized protein YjbI with pentapeptide repeats
MKASFRRDVQSPHLPKRLTAATLRDLEDYAEYASLTADGRDFSSQAAGHVVFEQVLLRRAVFNRTRLTQLRMLDARFEACDLSGADWEKARLRRVELAGSRLMGIQLLEAQLDDARFKDCNLEGAVFASAKFKAARFEDCVLRECSFEGADLSGVVFARCDLTDADLRESKLAGADLRGSILNGVRVGAKELAGAIISPTQAVQVASLLGVSVKDDDEPLESESTNA